MKTHRCKESLKHEVSIRYDKTFEFIKCEPTWNLRRLECNLNYDSTYLSFCCVVKYCPFCGKRLE